MVDQKNKKIICSAWNGIAFCRAEFNTLEDFYKHLKETHKGEF